MPSIPIQITGVLTYTGLEVGGGPMPGGPSVMPPIYYPPGGVGIWPSPGVPTHPIAPGGPPPTIWPSPGHPSHPIAPGGAPPGFWGGVAPPMPSHPIAPGGGGGVGIWPSPGVPTHPIVIPPGSIDGVHPEHPIYISPGVPTHPIVIPEPPAEPKFEVKAVWSEASGWVVVIVPAGGSGPIPTPGRKVP